MPRAATERYKTALAQAKADLQEAIAEQDRIEERAEQVKEDISALRRIVAGLSDYCGVPNENWMGLTEGITDLMARQLGEVTTAEVVTQLVDMGFDIGSQKNAPASVHAILSRLAKRKEIEKVEDGNTVKWRGPKYDDIPF